MSRIGKAARCYLEIAEEVPKEREGGRTHTIHNVLSSQLHWTPMFFHCQQRSLDIAQLESAPLSREVGCANEALLPCNLSCQLYPTAAAEKS